MAEKNNKNKEISVRHYMSTLITVQFIDVFLKYITIWNTFYFTSTQIEFWVNFLYFMLECAKIKLIWTSFDKLIARKIIFETRLQICKKYSNGPLYILWTVFSLLSIYGRRKEWIRIISEENMRLETLLQYSE